MAKQNLLDILKATDLEELRRELAELEGKKELALRAIQNDIDALTLAIKLADLAQNGKPARKTKTDRKPPPERVEKSARPVNNGPTITDRAVTYLQAAGEATARAIAHGLNYENVSYLSSCLQHDVRFIRKEGGMYKLA